MTKSHNILLPVPEVEGLI